MWMRKNKQVAASNPASDIAGGTNDEICKASELSHYSRQGCVEIKVKFADRRSAHIGYRHLNKAVIL
jgi:hypothetical protein